MESRSKSCCAPSMCCGVPVETGCFIFAIVNTVICLAASLGSLAFLIFVVYTWIDASSRGPNDMVLVYLFTGMATGCCVASALALTFAVVLVIGVKNRNNRYVMAYLKYGICVVVVSVGGCAGYLTLQWGEKDLMVWTLIPLGICVIYSLLLLLVYQTTVVFSERKPPTHTRLLNTYDG